MHKFLIPTIAASTVFGTIALTPDSALANRHLSNIDDTALMSACTQQKPLWFLLGAPSLALRSDRTVFCLADVQLEASGSTMAEAKNNLNAQANARGIKGSVNVGSFGSGSVQWKAAISKTSWTASLTDYCRKNTMNFYDTQRMLGMTNRVFVAEGGYACHLQE